MSHNRFLDRRRQRRIAFFVTWRFPVADQAGVYGQIDRLSAELDAEVAVFHAGMSDPRDLPEGLRPLVGHGFFVPAHDQIQWNDIEHFRRTLPDRFGSAIETLRLVVGGDENELLSRHDVRSAFSFARWVQAWGADYVHSYYLYEQSFQALVTAHLLDLPRGITLHELETASPLGLLLPYHVRQAAVIVAGHARVREGLANAFGPEVAAKVILEEASTDGALAVPHAIRRAMGRARPGGAAGLGPSAAFVTRCTPPSVHRGPAKSFLVLGAERTGSNMLVGILSSNEKIDCAGELFNPRFKEEDVVPWFRDRAEGIADLVALRREGPAKLLARLFQEGVAHGALAVGFKLLYYHGVIDDRIVDHLVAQRDMPVIHLLRRDRMRRWISHVRAEESDSWFTPRKGSPAEAQVTPVELDIEATLVDFAYQELMEERYAAVFAEHRCVELDYDDLTADRVGTARILEKLLGVQLGELTPRSQKTGLRALSRNVGNLDALRDAFRGTRWAPLLDSE